jgi:formylglycine-generating enzyme required for sulfatase activity
MSFVLNVDEKEPKLPKGFYKNYSYIPAGELNIEDKLYKIGEFYISKEEVTNREYRQFLAAVSRSEYKPSFNGLAIDSANWAHIDGEGYAKHYHSHPAYDNYPIVNISYEAALEYCKWVTENFNKNSDNDFTLEFKLPSRAEWMKAAQGSKQYTPYSWGGPRVRNAKGEILANFKIMGSENIHYDQTTNSYKVIEELMSKEAMKKIYSGRDITAPTKSYAPNDFGLYNMNGNVAEMLIEKGTAAGGSWNSPGYDIRNESVMTFQKASPMVGFRPIVVIKKK